MNNLIVSILVLVVAGCAGNATKTMTAEDIVSAKALQHQEAVREKDYKRSYSMLAPGYRAITPYSIYLAQRSTATVRESAAVYSIQCGENACDVEMELKYRYNALQGFHIDPKDPPITRINAEKWVLVDGDWWLFSDIGRKLQ